MVVSNGFNDFFKPFLIRNNDRVNFCPLFDVSEANWEVLGRKIDELTFINVIE